MSWEPGCDLDPFFAVEQPLEQTALLRCNYKGLPNNLLVAIRDKMKMVESSHTSASSAVLTRPKYSETVWKLLCNQEIGLSKLGSAWSDSAPWLSEDLDGEENLRILFSGPLEIEFPTDFLTPVPAALTMTEHLASVLATFANLRGCEQRLVATTNSRIQLVCNILGLFWQDCLGSDFEDWFYFSLSSVWSEVWKE